MSGAHEFSTPITRGFYFRTGKTIEEFFPHIGLFIGGKGYAAEITLTANIIDFIGVGHQTTDDGRRATGCNTMSAAFFRARITIRIFYNEILVGIYQTIHRIGINGIILQIIFVLYPIYNAMGNSDFYVNSINDCLFY